MIGKRLQPYINDIERRMDKLQTYEFKEEDIIGILNLSASFINLIDFR